MRKIGSDKKIEEKRKRNATITGLFLLAILILGTVGYGFISSPNAQTNEENSGLEEGKVVNQGGTWMANFNGQVLYFTNSPDSVRNISVDITSNLNTFASSRTYIDSTDPAITREIASSLGLYSRLQEACYGKCERDLPERDCSENLIIWKDSLERKIYQEEKCIFIEGDLKTVDAFLYKIFGLE